MRTFRFLDFPVYKSAKKLYKKILALTESLKNYSLKDQVRRAALSVLLNIAEGSARTSDKEFYRFLQSSLGSINEVYACLDVMKECGLLSSEYFADLGQDCEEITKQIGGLSKKIIQDTYR